MDNNEIPKAPRAMLMSEKVRMPEDHQLPQDHNKDSNVNLQIPIHSPAIGGTPAIVHEAAPTNCSSTPVGEGIAIPMDSKFLSPAKGMEREEGEISSRPSSATSDVARRMSPPKRYSLDGGKRPRRSSSPEPVRHRLSPSRTYRNRSPECSVRSPERFVRPSSRRSQSPSHPRRPISPEYMTSPPSPRQRRSYPSPRIPHAFEPALPISPRSATHKRRGSGYDRRRSRDSDGQPHLSRRRDSYNKELLTSPYPEGHKDAFTARSDSVDSSHTQQSKTSINSTNHKTGDHHRSLSGPTPSPSSIPRLLPDAANFNLDCSPQVVKPCHNVPGPWMVKSGRKSVEIVTCEFEIDNIAADRWGIRGSSRYVYPSYLTNL